MIEPLTFLQRLNNLAIRYIIIEYRESTDINIIVSYYVIPEVNCIQDNLYTYYNAKSRSDLLVMLSDMYILRPASESPNSYMLGGVAMN